MQKFDEEALSAATTLPMPPVAARAPKRTPVDPLVCYVMDGFLRGLNLLANSPRISVENFAERLATAMPPDLRIKLRDPRYEIPEEMWLLIRELSEDEQARVIYTIIWHVHMCEAMYLVCVATPRGGNPLETLRGREHLALPLELAGEARFWEIWAKVKEFLPKLGLDQWVSRDFRGNVEYPAVIARLVAQRELIMRLFHLDTHLGMEKFLRSPSAAMAKVPSLLGWPRELDVFNSDEAILDTIARYAAVH